MQRECCDKYYLVNMASTIQEELLHYVWKLKSFDHTDLKTVDGQKLDIIHPGYHNHDAGPDFLDAKIELDNTLWAGQVEIHIRSSDWMRHRHDADDAYQNVVLHVVYEDDAEIKRKDDTIIPTLELGPLISTHLLDRYHQLYNNQLWVPCQEQISTVADITKAITKEQALTQRLAYRARQLRELQDELGGDMITLIYQRLAWAFGLKVNAPAMHRLVTLTPYQIIQKHLDQPHQIEALLFGQSGLLPEHSDDTYVNILHREYAVLKQKFSLTAMSSVEWKYAKLRPANFPTIRIAQFASFLRKHHRLDDLILEADVREITDALDIALGDYWKTHYKFDKESISRVKKLGKSSKHTIIINAVVPLLFMYGMVRKSQRYKDRALALIESLPPEKNSIISKWEALGMSATSASDTQALIELKKQNCDLQGCMSCPIGHKIMSS